MKSLIIDDDPKWRDLCAAWLGNSGVYRAESMARAEIEMRLTDFDLIVLDLGLPDSQPSATAKWAATLVNRQPSATLVVVSGTSDPSRFRELLDVADGCARKDDISTRFGFLRFVTEAERTRNAKPVFARASSVFAWLAHRPKLCAA